MARSSLPPPNSRIAAAKPALEHPQIIRLAAVDSTQRYAAALAASGAEDGTVVVAETQTAGRGRRGRLWIDAPGASLLMSIVLRTSLPLTRVPTLSIAAGVAVADALGSAGVEAQLKWPNDVLASGRKIAGVLLERSGDAVILGIGVNMTEASVPADLATKATSVAEQGGCADREGLLAAVLRAVAHWRARLEQEGFEPVRGRWTARAAMLNQRVVVDGVAGTALGLDEDGALLLQTDTGITRVVAGDVLSG